MQQAAGLLCLGLACAPGQAQTADRTDFRMVPMDPVGVIDLGSMAVKGNVRELDMYGRERNPADTTRLHIALNCDKRTSRILTIAQREENGEMGSPITVNSPEGKADADESGALLANLICAAPAERDRYARRIAASDWQSALDQAAQAMATKR